MKMVNGSFVKEGQSLRACFFTRQINPRSLGSQCLKGTDESTQEMDSSVPLTCHDPKDLGLICLVKKRKIRFQILSNLKIQSWIFLKKRTLSCCDWFSMKLHEMMFRIKTFFDSDNNFHFPSAHGNEFCNPIGS